MPKKRIVFKIEVPIWHSRSIGLDAGRVEPDTICEVHILYKRKDGTRSYPDTYEIDAEKALKHPRQLRFGVFLHIIPIANMTIKPKKRKGKLYKAIMVDGQRDFVEVKNGTDTDS